MMLDGFTLLAVPYYYSDLIIAIVLLIALVLSSDRVTKRRTLKRAASGPETSSEVSP